MVICRLWVVTSRFHIGPRRPFWSVAPSVLAATLACHAVSFAATGLGIPAAQVSSSNVNHVATATLTRPVHELCAGFGAVGTSLGENSQKTKGLTSKVAFVWHNDLLYHKRSALSMVWWLGWTL